MHDENERSEEAALAELRRRLGDELARRRWTKTQLARQAGLGRTTVSEAFQDGGPVPSEQTVAALAHALRLDVEELLELRRSAAAAPLVAGSAVSGADDAGLGRLIGQWDPHDLEVHPAGPALPATRTTGGPGDRMLPGYVRREHDQVLTQAVAEAVAGGSRMVVVVGSSSTGKTRACWEAVQPLAAKGWRLWHPFDPTRAEAALDDLHRVGPRTVVWLNEAQHYLGDREHGERIAAALHHLLVTPERGPVLVLGTLWPEYAHQYRALPSPDAPDPHSRARELLAGRTLTVPEAFDASALAAAAELAQRGDTLLADALTRANEHGRLTQDLAGAPELLHQLHNASPPARALLEAAMDARRLGVSPHLPQAFLTDAAVDYLTDAEYDDLTGAWAEHAYAELAQPVHGKQSGLRTTTPRPARRPVPPTERRASSPQSAGPTVRLADYLEQHGRTTRSHLCPPASFWHAAHTHLTHPDDLHNLTQEAHTRLRRQWAHHLRHRAAAHGSTTAMIELARRGEETGDLKGAETAYREAADHGDAHALVRLARMRNKAGDLRGAEALYREAADHGESSALVEMARRRAEAGDLKGAETLYRQAADHGESYGLISMAHMREEGGDVKGAVTLYRQAADQNDPLYAPYAWEKLAQMREKAGDLKGAEALLREAADHGHPSPLAELARMREESGDLEGFEALLKEATDQDDPTYAPYAWERLVRLREEAGDLKGAEAVLREAADHHNPSALAAIARMRERAGDLSDAETLYRQIVDHDNPTYAPYALVRLVEMRERAGDLKGAETLYRQAADHGASSALAVIARMREAAGDLKGAETLYREAADHGASYDAEDDLIRLWPYGLDPDGTPTAPWTSF
ncbi:helix-turn-helix domain-containing protein [Streptomyces hydrogenans]|uniref:helix-turn-helix domain-containing protein n=1 Tax=Streptomyces hydrogenans TaxID=1873719 RepID=UPI0036B4057B